MNNCVSIICKILTRYRNNGLHNTPYMRIVFIGKN
ncbi:hypothetical protein [Magpiepox virus 2]|nr:hypothetical protein [Magpiepox virus 2]